MFVSVSFFFSRSGAHRDLHSFPTRRSSDLRVAAADGSGLEEARESAPGRGPRCAGSVRPRRRGAARLYAAGVRRRDRARSEEHTSELQSLAYLVCRLLLEKKKIKNTIYPVL